ncbi:MAG: hypothetical protein BWX69_03290 [Planctomycetes bacterium ADurb.Bin069]|nr:MAG: hypothetical protein BWX69_03290 [Planctomycetes bacterium ADurb.Bin069]
MKTFTLFFAAAASCCLTAAAQTAAPAPQAPAAKPAPRAMTPEIRAKLMARTGGMIQSKAEGPSVLFLNTQSRVDAAALTEPVAQVNTMLRLPALSKDAPTDAPLTAALEALKDPAVASVVVVGDSAGYPALLVAPESRWALVNVAALGGPDTAPDTLTERTRKEVWRAFGYLMGAAHSNFEACLMKPVLAPEDLDALKGKGLSPEPFNKILAHAQKLGIKPARMTTYRKAVEEGWAPAPTNDFQKAIWEEVKKQTKNE